MMVVLRTMNDDPMLWGASNQPGRAVRAQADGARGTRADHVVQRMHRPPRTVTSDPLTPPLRAQ